MKRIFIFTVVSIVFSVFLIQGFGFAQSSDLKTSISKPQNFADQHINDSRSIFVNIIPDTVCVFLNETFSFEGLIEASGYTMVQWLNLSGYGYFSNENILETQYTPNVLDALLDGVYLMVYVSDGENLATDVVTLKVISLNAGVASNVCSDQEFQTMAEVTEYESLLWTTSGDGVFSDPNTLNPLYSPGANDISSGWAQLTLTATVGSPCNITGSATMDLTIVSPPGLLIDVEDAEVEMGQSVVLSIVASNANGYQWYGPQGLIEGAVNPDLEIWEANNEHSGNYYCEFYNDCGSQVSRTAMLTVYQLHTINLPAGWSGLSSWVTPFETNIENLFQPVMGNLVILQNSNGVFDPGANINTLVTWDEHSGYQVKTNLPFDLVLKGSATQNLTITLQAGWNLLPVLSSCEVDVETLFATVAQIKQVKEIAGFKVFWPEMNINSLDALIPGNAYMIYVTGQTEIAFPSCSK